MFSFFSKKPKFTVRVKEYTTPLLIGGLWTEVHKKTLKKEIGSLQTRFQELRPNLKQLSDPKGHFAAGRTGRQLCLLYRRADRHRGAGQQLCRRIFGVRPLCPHQRIVPRPYRAYLGCGAGQAVLF